MPIFADCFDISFALGVAVAKRALASFPPICAGVHDAPPLFPAILMLRRLMMGEISRLSLDAASAALYAAILIASLQHATLRCTVIRRCPLSRSAQKKRGHIAFRHSRRLPRRHIRLLFGEILLLSDAVALSRRASRQPTFPHFSLSLPCVGKRRSFRAARILSGHGRLGRAHTSSTRSMSFEEDYYLIIYLIYIYR